MSEGISDKLEEIFSKVRPSLGGADIKLREVRGGTVVVDYCRALTNRSCHANRTQTTEEVIAEILEDEIREVVPDFENVIVIEQGAAL